MKATQYKLQTIATGRLFDDDGWNLSDPQCEQPSLVRAVYEKKQLDTANGEAGIYKYADWLPINRSLNSEAEPITYKSDKLASLLGLSNLYITFSGYWPERGAKMTTCSFKELEALSVCARLNKENDKVLVVSSAGNTARAFAKVCSENNISLLLCVPQDNVGALWFEHPLNDCVKLIATATGSDYFDAIQLGDFVCKTNGFMAEGGAKNIARRDGMGCTMLSAATFIGRTPDYYFQAVGSGTGAIAAWEANMRFIADGRYGSKKARLMLSQNTPFLPMYEAWQAHSRALLPYDVAKARRDAAEICAPVLSNRKPPYSLAGGLYDALSDTNGTIIAITNEEALKAQQLFADTEGIDIHSAAAVATASLVKAVENKMIRTNEVVMLNITGGGEKRFKAEHKTQTLAPSHIFPLGFTEDNVRNVVEEIYNR